MDNEANRSTGSAFACFWNKEDADKVIDLSQALNKETGLVCKLCIYESGCLKEQSDRDG